MCNARGIVHEFACRADLVSIGLYFAIDFGAAVYGPQVKGRTRALVPVHVPSEINVPLADGSRVLHALFGFVELNGHAVVFVRIGPAHFIRYGDLDRGQCYRFARMAGDAVQLRARVSPALYRRGSV
jgi:hypothetical protein